jgi:L-fuconolactonase
MRIDAHQHFWRYNDREYGWMGSAMDALKRDHLPPELEGLLRSAGFDGSVAVQARQVPEETRWLLDLADEYGYIKGIVGWVDLRGPRLREQLEEFAADPKFCGVRHVVHDEPDDLFVLRDDFLKGMALLAEFDLAYDLLLFPRQLPAACRLVEMLPGQRFVLDHIAKPAIREGLLEPWASDLRRLAAFPNVFCKASGMVTEADWTAWQPVHFRPYLDAVFEAFGPGRMMIGSDWPVCTVSAPYERVMAIVVEYIQRYTPREREMVLGKNAVRAYRLQG